MRLAAESRALKAGWTALAGAVVFIRKKKCHIKLIPKRMLLLKTLSLGVLKHLCLSVL